MWDEIEEFEACLSDDTYQLFPLQRVPAPPPPRPFLDFLSVACIWKALILNSWWIFHRFEFSTVYEVPLSFSFMLNKGFESSVCVCVYVSWVYRCQIRFVWLMYKAGDEVVLGEKDCRVCDHHSWSSRVNWEHLGKTNYSVEMIDSPSKKYTYLLVSLIFISMVTDCCQSHNKRRSLTNTHVYGRSASWHLGTKMLFTSRAPWHKAHCRIQLVIWDFCWEARHFDARLPFSTAWGEPWNCRQEPCLPWPLEPATSQVRKLSVRNTFSNTKSSAKCTHQ